MCNCTFMRINVRILYSLIHVLGLLRDDDQLRLLDELASIHVYVSLLCLTSYRQQGHLETAPPFTVPGPCEGYEAQFFFHRPHVVAWQSITQPLHYASSNAYMNICMP